MEISQTEKKQIINRLLREIYQDIKRIYYSPLDDLTSFVIKENGKKYMWIWDLMNDYINTDMKKYLQDHPETELPRLQDHPITPQDCIQLNLFSNLKQA